MITINIKEKENLDTALRRFKRAIDKNGILIDLKLKEFYEKPTSKRKRKFKESIIRNLKYIFSKNLPKKKF